MSKGKVLCICRTCRSQIVQGVNDGVYNEGECESCEYHRYTTQPLLLDAAERLLHDWDKRNLSGAIQRLIHTVESCRR